MASASVAGASTPATTRTTFFAGYIAGITGTATAFGVHVSIPTMTCPATGSIELQTEVELHTSGNFLVFSNSVSCSDGTATSEGFEAGIFPSSGGFDAAAANLATLPGDSLNMSLKIASSRKATMKISDTTAGTSASATAPVAGSLTSVEAGTGVFGSSPTVVPQFTPIAFTSLKVGSASLSSLSPGKYEIYNGNRLQVSTGRLSSRGSFTNTFVHS